MGRDREKTAVETTAAGWTNGMAWPRPRVALCVRERHRETGAAIFGRNVMTRMLMMMSRRQRHLFIGIWPLWVGP